MSNYKERMLKLRQEQKEKAESRDFLKVERFKPARNPDGSECVTVIRILPYEDDGYPFFETHMLYELCKLAEHWPFTEPYRTYEVENPVQEFLGDLYKVNPELYKKLRPQSAYNVWVIEKDDPEFTPKLWTLSYTQYNTLVKFILEDENFEDIDMFSVTSGLDIKITTKYKMTDKGTVALYNGKKTYETTITPLLKSQGPLIADKKGKIVQDAVDKLLDSLHRREDIYKYPTNEEMESMLEKLREMVLGESGSSSNQDDTDDSVDSDEHDADGEDEDDDDIASEFEDIMNS